MQIARLLVFVGFVVVLSSGCASPSRQKRDLTKPAVHVHVKRLKTEDSWLVTYDLAQPLKELRFDRQTSQFRREHWKVLTPGVAIALVDGKESFVSEKPVAKIELKLRSYYEQTPKDYEFHFRYSDGSIMMYTGHFLADDPRYADEDAPPTSFTFEPAAGENTIILDKVYRGRRIEWTDSHGQGTYVYFGNIKPIVHKRFVGVIDPGLPKWFRESAFEMLPKLFDYYTDKTGIALSFKPVVFFNFWPNEKGGFSNTGGTLPGLVHLSMEGSPKAEVSKSRAQNTLKFFAHEAAHFWNGQMHRADDKEGWMKEGGADAFAHRAIRDLKIIAHEEFEFAHTKTLNECVQGLQGLSLGGSYEARQYQNMYRCGMLMALLTEVELKRAGYANGLFGFWKELFARSQTNKRKYTQAMYLELLEEKVGDTKLVSRFNELINEPRDDWNSYWHSTLNEFGLKASFETRDLGESFQALWGRDALRQLMKIDCKDRFGLSDRGPYLQTDAIAGCSTFTSRFEVEKVEGFDVILQGGKAYDAAAAKCAQGEPVRLTMYRSRKSVNVPCKGLPEKQAYLKVAL